MIRPLYKRSGLYIVAVVGLFVLISILTTIQPAYRFSSQTIEQWTNEIDSSTFLYLIGMENRAFQEAYPEDQPVPKLSTTLFQMTTSMKPNDPRSLLGREIPGFSIYDNQLIVAGEGTNYTNLTYESSPPLEDVLKDREAEITIEEDEEDHTDNREDTPTTGERNVVFIYSTHNRESFLPHLPDEEDPDLAQHSEVNITMVNERLKDQLEKYGIGSQIDDTDIMTVLNNKGWSYGQAYNASREVVQEAFSSNKDIQYIFDIHRDSQRRDVTTKEINGKSYARIMMVVGEDSANYEQNAKLASQLHKLMEEKYPGLSRGVEPKGGPQSNGVYNQDLSDNAILFELGGVDNNMDELYRSADALAEVFSEFYWDAEKVDTSETR